MHKFAKKKKCTQTVCRAYLNAQATEKKEVFGDYSTKTSVYVIDVNG